MRCIALCDTTQPHLVSAHCAFIDFASIGIVASFVRDLLLRFFSFFIESRLIQSDLFA